MRRTKKQIKYDSVRLCFEKNYAIIPIDSKWERLKNMDKVTQYIKEHREKTVHAASELAGDVKINHPYVSPCPTAEVYRYFAENEKI